MRIAIIISIILWLCVYTLLKEGRTPEFTDANCVRALIGEYAKEDAYGMSLMAHAIRNRGTLRGVNGFYAHHVNFESKQLWAMATLAWFQSRYDRIDPISGADEWRSIDDIRRGHIPKHARLIKIYNGTYFYQTKVVIINHQ